MKDATKMIKSKSVTVVGSGYVGMSLAVLLSQHNDVVILDIDAERVNKINKLESPIVDKKTEYFLANKKLQLRATVNKEDAYRKSDFIIIAVPTNYDPDTNFFDTSALESVLKDITEINLEALIVIKSTVPIGFTDKQIGILKNNNIVFSPEFLREGSALEDNLNPSRLIIGGLYSTKFNEFAKLLLQASEKKDYETLFMNSSEAESVKLFSNTYLAMRVAFFNELDTFAISKSLNAEDIIRGVSLDYRIGDFYNNPSFGYGGYCLPKDTKQLLANFDKTSQNIISAVVESNLTRMDFLVNDILKLNPKVIGIYRLVMKTGSDNFRDSAVQGLINRLKKSVKIIIFEPLLNSNNFLECSVVNNFSIFKTESDVILANRLYDELSEISNKVYTRDISNSDA